jgi:hypothetical protein
MPWEAGNSRRADAGTRTPDPFITSEVLYQLSYVGGMAGRAGSQTIIVAPGSSPEAVAAPGSGG